jgi:hypothetical protein
LESGVLHLWVTTPTASKLHTKDNASEVTRGTDVLQCEVALFQIYRMIKATIQSQHSDATLLLTAKLIQAFHMNK